MDGGSTDGTLEILSSYPALQLSSEPDEGQSDALNKGLGSAGGDVIGWLNSDDLYEHGALDAVAKIFADEADTQWLYGKVRIIDAYDGEIRRFITAYKNRQMRSFRYDRLLAENWISQMGVFWRREAGQSVGMFRTDLNWAMDYDYWLRLAGFSPGRFLDRYLACYRWYPQSKCGSDFRGQLREEFQVARSHSKQQHLPLLLHRFNHVKTLAAYTLLAAGRKLWPPASSLS